MGDNGFPEGVDVEKVKAAIQGADSPTQAFKSQDVVNAMEILMKQDKDFLDNTFRYDVPSGKVALCASIIVQRCTEHDYENGLLWLKYLLGLTASVHGKRVNVFSDTVIGERRWKEGIRGQGFFNKAKEWMTGGS